MTTLTFYVPGVVSGQGSKRPVSRGGKTVLLDMNANLRPWRDSIWTVARQAAQEQLNWRDHHGPVFTGAVDAYIEAVYARPKSHYGTGKNGSTLKLDAPYWKTSAPDGDKIFRAFGDAITQSGIWRDDAYVARQGSEKHYTDPAKAPGLYVTLEDLA